MFNGYSTGNAIEKSQLFRRSGKLPLFSREIRGLCRIGKCGYGQPANHNCSADPFKKTHFHRQSLCVKIKADSQMGIGRLGSGRGAPGRGPPGLGAPGRTPGRGAGLPGRGAGRGPPGLGAPGRTPGRGAPGRGTGLPGRGAGRGPPGLGAPGRTPGRGAPGLGAPGRGAPGRGAGLPGRGAGRSIGTMRRGGFGFTRKQRCCHSNGKQTHQRTKKGTSIHSFYLLPMPTGQEPICRHSALPFIMQEYSKKRTRI